MRNQEELTITTEKDNGNAVMSVVGKVTIDSSPDLRTRLLFMLQAGTLSRLSVNLTGVPYIDCSGLATLVEALRVARRRGIEMELSGLHDRVLFLFQVSGLLNLFQQALRDHRGPAQARS